MNKEEAEVITYLMKDSPISSIQAIRIVLEGMEGLGEQLRPKEALTTLRRCMQLGVQALASEQASLDFGEAVARCLEARRDRSPRTIQDFRQCMNALMRVEPALATTAMGSLTPERCSQLLNGAFSTAPRRRKAHACLSSLFYHGMRMGWCHGNPMKQLELPRVREKPIAPLLMEEVERLLATALMPRHACCAPALGLMLYAGVRPHEVARLAWDDVDLDEGEISVPARHAKTGGGRHIPICPALLSLLRRAPRPGQAAICPPNWQNRWKALRREAGFSHWQPDVLRHTFASYFAKAYHDLPTLQLYMGHRDVKLLLTRYVNLKGLRHHDALRFWGSPSQGWPAPWAHGRPHARPKGSRCQDGN